jgi:endonuclease-8
MEGPSLYLAVRQLAPFKGRIVRSAFGNTKIDKTRFVGKKVNDIFSWGKHLLFQFDDCALKVHFLLFGTFDATVEGASVTGDYKKTRVPRLSFVFENGIINMYNCSVKIIEDRRLKRSYDFSSDVMSRAWNAALALKKMRQFPSSEIADVLLDQDIFSGVGNIIKNEILSIARVNPKQPVSTISVRKQRNVVALARSFSQQFYRWRKAFALRKHLLIYQKSRCPHCEGKVIREKTGKRARWSYYCPECQPLGVHMI